MAAKDIIKHQFKKGQSGNASGKPAGIKNRSTIAKQILSMRYALPDDIFKNLKSMHPDIERNMSIEEIMTIIIANKAINEQDVASYKAVMDSGYGLPKSEIDVTSGGKEMNEYFQLFGKKIEVK